MFIDIQKIAGGQPLPDGQVFIGLIGTDPVDSPVSVYSDYECTVSISTPLTLDDNGLPIDSSGNQVNLYANFDFSIQLKDKYGADFYQNYVDVKVPAASDSPAVITGERTFVVPVGESFRIVDDADNPTIIVGVSNRDPDSQYTSASIGLSFYANDGTNIIGHFFTQIVDPLNVNYGSASKYEYLKNANGQNVIVAGIETNGATSLTSNAQILIFSGIPTYADNAAALADGHPIGAEYYTPAGASYRVI